MRTKLNFFIIVDKRQGVCYLMEQCGNTENCVGKYYCFASKTKVEQAKREKTDITQTKIYKRVQWRADELNERQEKIHGTSNIGN